jgi:hypothetical protein
MDRISHGVDFDTTPIETALNWGRACELALFQGMEQMRDNRRFEAPKARGVE